MITKLTGGALLALVISTLGATTPAQAADEAPVITGVTTANEAGGLTPYVPLATRVVVTFTDASPSDETAYRLKVPGVGTFKDARLSDGAFTIGLDAYQLPVDTELAYVVKEMQGGKVVGASEPVPFTFAYVGHPRRFSTSSEKINGEWSYHAGDTARFRFKGPWEDGTTYSTQVWVSRTKKFSPKDFTFNTRKDGDLVTTSYEQKPVLAVKIPPRVAGKYVWVSILGWKDGKGGWLWTVPAEHVVKR